MIFDLSHLCLKSGVVLEEYHVDGNVRGHVHGAVAVDALQEPQDGLDDPVEQRVVRRGHSVLGRLRVPVRVPDVAFHHLVLPLSMVETLKVESVQCPMLPNLCLLWLHTRVV